MDPMTLGAGYPPSDPATMNRCLKQAQRGSSDALAYIMRIYEPALRRKASRHLTGFPFLVDDAMQELWIAAWKRIGGMRCSTHLRQWLYVTLRHRCIDQLRRYSTRARHMEVCKTARPLTPDSLPRQSDVDDAEDHERLMAKALSRMTARQRAVVELHYRERFTAREIGEVLGSSHTAAKMTLYRARVRAGADPGS